jgi:hypothetical protein
MGVGGLGCFKTLLLSACGSCLHATVAYPLLYDSLLILSQAALIQLLEDVVSPARTVAAISLCWTVSWSVFDCFDRLAETLLTFSSQSHCLQRQTFVPGSSIVQAALGPSQERQNPSTVPLHSISDAPLLLLLLKLGLQGHTGAVKLPWQDLVLL